MTRFAILVAMLAACEPTLDQRLDQIDAPRVIAVLSDPAEVAPGETAHHRAVVAAPAGELAPDVAWAFCTEPKPPTEDNVVNAACLGDAAAAPIATGPEIDATMPDDACQRFGPDTPPGGYRPRDPDITGGYYQPLRVVLPADLGDAVGFASHRIACDLANAPPDVATAYRMRYTRNLDPPAPDVRRADGIDLAAPIAASAEVDLTATWPAAAAEPYVSYDQPTASLLDRREAMRVTWYATGGGFAADATGVAEDDPATATTNRFIAPEVAGPITVWVVLRDSRGGAAVSRLTVSVE